jgi:hypothetical protein
MSERAQQLIESYRRTGTVSLTEAPTLRWDGGAATSGPYSFEIREVDKMGSSRGRGRSTTRYELVVNQGGYGAGAWKRSGAPSTNVERLKQRAEGIASGEMSESQLDEVRVRQMPAVSKRIEERMAAIELDSMYQSVLALSDGFELGERGAVIDFLQTKINQWLGG